MIIPVGHDRSIFHIPYLTITIIALCTGMQLYAFWKEPSAWQSQALIAKENNLRTKIWSQHGLQWLKEHPPSSAVERKADRGSELPYGTQEMVIHLDRFFTEYEAGRIVARDDPDFLMLQELRREKEKATSLLRLGYNPDRKFYTLITYTFIHGGWLHLLGNMLFLWLCGCNMEDRWGRWVWMALYFGGGAVAALCYGAMHPRTEVPLVGASGAIAAAMGAFLVIYHKAYIRLFYVFWFGGRILHGTFEMRAFWALPLWFLQQVLGLMMEGQNATVAYSAHVSGFAAGLVFALIMKGLGTDRFLSRISEEKATVFSQHPLFLEGIAYLEHGEKTKAGHCFSQLLQEQPDHLDAAFELFRLTLESGNADEGARMTARAIDACKRVGDMATVRTIYVETRQKAPNLVLDERSLFTIAQAYESVDPNVSTILYEELVNHYPQSPIVPMVLLSSARLYQEKLHNIDKALALLQVVTEKYSGTPYADRAQVLLSSSFSPPPSSPLT